MRTRRRAERDGGMALIAAIFLIVVVGFLGIIAVSLLSTQTFSSLNEMQSTQAFFVAQGGMERAMRLLLSPNVGAGGERVSCAAANFPGANIALGQGFFSLTLANPAPYYSNGATTLNGAITATDVPVAGGTAAFPSYGRIMIDRELIDYSGKTGASFTGPVRGRDGTAAVTHAVGTRVGQNQCMVISTGGVPNLGAGAVGQRELRAAFQLQEGWAVGDSPNAGTTRATLLHWDGVNWTDANTSPTPLPANANQHLMGISMLSYADGWAVGNTGGGGGGSCTTNLARIVNWNGTAWSCNATSPSNQNLNFVSMFSATDGWAVGAGGSMVQWVGGAWSERNAAQNYTAQELHSVSVLAANEVWMTGRDENQNGKSCGRNTALILRYTGALPPSCPNTGAPAIRFRAIFMLDGPDAGAAPDDGWIVGDQNGGSFRIYRWNPITSQWDNYSIADGRRANLNSLYMLDTDGDGLGDDGWAVGDVRTSGGVTRVTILRWNHSCAGGAVTGVWAICSFDPGAASRQNLNSVSCATVNDCWAVGNAGIILHWGGNSWTVHPQSGVVTTRNLRGVYVIGPRIQPQAMWREVFK